MAHKRVVEGRHSQQVLGMLERQIMFFSYSLRGGVRPDAGFMIQQVTIIVQALKMPP